MCTIVPLCLYVAHPGSSVPGMSLGKGVYSTCVRTGLWTLIRIPVPATVRSGLTTERTINFVGLYVRVKTILRVPPRIRHFFHSNRSGQKKREEIGLGGAVLTRFCHRNPNGLRGRTPPGPGLLAALEGPATGAFPGTILIGNRIREARGPGAFGVRAHVRVLQADIGTCDRTCKGQGALGYKPPVFSAKPTSPCSYEIAAKAL